MTKADDLITDDRLEELLSLCRANIVQADRRRTIAAVTIPASELIAIVLSLQASLAVLNERKAPCNRKT